jgi:hypothetical protein
MSNKHIGRGRRRKLIGIEMTEAAPAFTSGGFPLTFPTSRS